LLLVKEFKVSGIINNVSPTHILGVPQLDAEKSTNVTGIGLN
jgi:hypothetical protein